MKKCIRFLKNNYHYFVLFLTFAVTLCVSLSATLYGDDYFYMNPAVSSFPVILQFLKWHILKCNGRTLIHIFVIMFLRNNVTITLGKILCALGITSVCILVPKMLFKDGNRYRIAVCAASFILMTVRPNMFNQNVYWLTGSFNYLFPIIFLLIIMLISVKNRHSVWLLPMSFFGGATMEQIGMMCIGWFVLLLLDELIRNKSFDKKIFSCTLLSVIGYATVIFSPGTFSRFENQSGLNTQSFATILLTLARKNWFDNISLYVMITLLAFSACFWAYHFRKANRFTALVAKVGIPMLTILFLMNTALRAYLTFFGMILGRDIHFQEKLNSAIMCLWILYAVLFTLMTIYSGVMIYVKKGEFIPTASLILALGSQLMMVITKTVLFRACFPAIITFTIYIVYTAVCLGKQFILTRPAKKKSVKSLVKAGIIAACFVACIFQLYSGLYGDCLFVEDKQIVKPHSPQEMQELTDNMDVAMKEYYSSENSDLKIKYDATDFSLYK